MIYLLIFFSINAFSAEGAYPEKGFYFGGVKIEDYCYYFDGKARFCIKEEHEKILKRIEKLEKECKAASREGK